MRRTRAAFRNAVTNVNKEEELIIRERIADDVQW